MKEVFAKAKNKRRLLQELMPYTRTMTPETAEHLVRVLHKNTADFSKDGRENFWESEFDDANSLLLWTLNDRIPQDKIYSLVEEIVTETPDLYYAVETILHCKRERGGGWNNLYNAADNDALRDLTAERLKKELIEGGKDILQELPPVEWGFILYQWATNWSTDKKHLSLVSDYVFSLLENPKNLVSLLSKSRGRAIKVISGSPRTVPQGFDFEGFLGLLNIEKLREKATTLQDHDSLNDEEKQLVKDFLDITNPENTIDEDEQ